MDALTQTSAGETYRSRFSRDPILDAAGLPIVVLKPTRVDGLILRALARRRFGSVYELAGLTGCNVVWLRHRLRVLNANPNCYIRIANEQLQHQRNYMNSPIFYELDSVGIAHLDGKGIHLTPRKEPKQFEHQVMIDQIMASFEIGFRNLGMEYIQWMPDILQGSTLPEETRKSRSHAMPVSFTFRGKTYDRDYIADDKPFGGYKEKYVFCPGIEADTGEMPVKSYDFERSGIILKILCQLAIIETRSFKTKFNFPNMFFPIVTSTPSRKESIKDAIMEVTDGRGSKNILVKHMPRPKVATVTTGWAAEVPWQRAGHPDFYFDGRVSQ